MRAELRATDAIHVQRVAVDQERDDVVADEQSKLALNVDHQTFTCGGERLNGAVDRFRLGARHVEQRERGIRPPADVHSPCCLAARSAASCSCEIDLSGSPGLRVAPWSNVCSSGVSGSPRMHLRRTATSGESSCFRTGSDIREAYQLPVGSANRVPHRVLECAYNVSAWFRLRGVVKFAKGHKLSVLGGVDGTRIRPRDATQP